MKQSAAKKQEWLNKGHGRYEELQSEKDFFDACKKSDKVVCHFYRDSTFRCQIVDKHLTLLSSKHLETKFLKLCVDRAPFLCQRLNIRVLPTIAIVVNSITKDYIKGFDDLGGTDDFSTEMMEWRLGCAGVINYSGNLLEPPDQPQNGAQSRGRSILARTEKKSIRSGRLSSDSDED